MARRITNEDLVLNLILNADQVNKGNSKLLQELYKMDRATRDLQIRYDQLRLKEKELIQQQGKNAAGLKVIRTEMKALKKEIEANHLQMNEWRKQIGVAGLTINQLRSRLAMLRIQLHNATDPTVLKTLRKQITETTLRIERMTTGMTRAAQAWRHMGTMANQFGTLMAWVTITIFGVARAITATTKNLRQLDRQFSDVMKTTALTRGEVANLKKEFDQLNQDEGTRTPTRTKELLEISRIAGRLGIRGVENIRDFTLAVDKLYVSLHTDLEGSVEEITEQVGKLSNVFKIAEKEGLSQAEALLRVGSVINELGKSSEANAQRILNFATRMGGVGSMANFTIDQLAGVGATLDATGVAVERGSTAMIKIITGLGQNVEKFSRMLGITVEEYAKWAEEDINGLMIAMLEATSKGDASILEVTESMGDMEITGVRVAEVFGKLTQNIDLLTKQQEIAARAFESSASVMNEYYIVSRDWDSLMALQGKRIKALADDYSKSLTPSMYKAYRGFIDLAYAARDGMVWMRENSKIFAGLILLYVAFKSLKIVRAIDLMILSLRVETASRWRLFKAQIANNIALADMRKAYIAAGGGVKGLASAIKTLWGVISKNPINAWTAVIAAVSTAVGLFLIFKKRADEVKKAINEINTEISSQTTAMNFLFDAVERSNEGTKKRKELINELNKIYGKYLPNMLSEKSTITEIKDARIAANEALETEIALKMKADKLDTLREKQNKKIQKNLERLKIKPGVDKYREGEAMADFNQLQKKVLEQYQKTGEWNKELIDRFLKDYQDVFYTINDMINVPGAAPMQVMGWGDVVSIVKDNEKFINQIQEIDDYTQGYIDKLDEINEKIKPKPDTPGTLLDEREFETAKKKAEYERDQQKLMLMQMGLDRETYRKRELKLEEAFFRQMVELTKQRFTTPDGDVIGGSREILDAQLALQQNLNAQVEDGGANRLKLLEREMLQTEVILLEMLEKRQITQGQFDTLMLQMQEDHITASIAYLKRTGESTLEWEKKWYENRLNQQNLFLKQREALNKAMSYALNPEEEGTVTADDKLVDDLIEKRKKIAQFLGFDKDSELEKEFAIFETEDYLAQIAQLEQWYAEGSIRNEEELARRKEEILKKHMQQRLQINQQMLGMVNDLLSAQGNLFAAQKDAELKKAGDNERKKLRIQKEYAKKEQNIATAQAVIAGALAIMRIWEAKATGNAITDSIIKGILTAGMVATTGMQIAAIKAQQFAKGKYPVKGADDGRTYQAEFVGTPQTGIYKKPSLGLFAEKPEMVIDNPTLRNIQFNNSALIDAILAHRPRGQRAKNMGQKKVPQYAAGSWPVDGKAEDSVMKKLLEANLAMMKKLEQQKPVVAVELLERKLGEYKQIMESTGL